MTNVFSEYKVRHSFYMSKEWKVLRLYMLNKYPLCKHCKEKGKLTSSIDVDHIVDIEDAPEKRLDIDNLQTLCKSCHSKKTMEKVLKNKKENNETKIKTKWKI